MINSIVAFVQKKLEARRQYRRAVAEIEAMSNQELLELGAFQTDLYDAARAQYAASVR